MTLSNPNYLPKILAPIAFIYDNEDSISKTYIPEDTRILENRHVVLLAWSKLRSIIRIRLSGLRSPQIYLSSSYNKYDFPILSILHAMLGSEYKIVRKVKLSL